jgi:hypothetical protein
MGGTPPKEFRSSGLPPPEKIQPPGVFSLKEFLPKGKVKHSGQSAKIVLSVAWSYIL